MSAPTRRTESGFTLVEMLVAIAVASRLIIIRSRITFALACVMALASLSVAAEQTPAEQASSGLKIVVIEGQDAANIIQQKTAVAPVVEVRDRTDLPIAGAQVTFTISGGQGAAFSGGLRRLTVTTNAAGRAAVTGLNPVGTGTYQINVTAAYQGRTAAATISQTNYATEAQAAEAGGATAGASQPAAAGGRAGRAGAGGGLSTLAIAGIAGGAGVGGLVAYNALKATACTYAASTNAVSVGGNATTTTINVIASPADCDPEPWTVSGSGAFFTASPTSGSGNGSVTVNFSANNTGASRTGSLNIAGQTISMTQATACAFTVTPTFGLLGSSAQNVAVTVAAAPGGCAPNTWTASSSVSWITPSPASGSGNGTVTLEIAQNAQGAPARSGNVTVAGRTVAVQQGPGAGACNQQNLAGGDVPESRTVELGRASGTFSFSYHTEFQRDRMMVVYEGRTLFDTGCVGTNGTRTQNITYAGNSTQVTIQVQPNCAGGSGTFWEFTVSCPR